MSIPSVSLRQLFEAKGHFGHLSRFREPKMAAYVYGIQNGLHIINLEETRRRLVEAMQYLSRIAARPGSRILFVGTKRAAQAVIKEQAQRAGMPYVDRHWPGGMLTNYRTIRQSVKRLKELEAMSQEGIFKGLTKKEALGLTRQLAKLERDVGGIKEMNGLPDALFVIDVGYEHIAVSEAKKLRIPIVAVVDTNHSPDGIDYVIPGNDDAASAIRLYVTLMADAILAARSVSETDTGTGAGSGNPAARPPASVATADAPAPPAVVETAGTPTLSAEDAQVSEPTS